MAAFVLDAMPDTYGKVLDLDDRNGVSFRAQMLRQEMRCLEVVLLTQKTVEVTSRQSYPVARWNSGLGPLRKCIPPRLVGNMVVQLNRVPLKMDFTEINPEGGESYWAYW
ncbi:hypothetical protein TNCV_2844151 [Trichonephila clavipes]|nr:hypothetical protein TNCV_2844151 [Trichonephila clavipes]